MLLLINLFPVLATASYLFQPSQTRHFIDLLSEALLGLSSMPVVGRLVPAIPASLQILHDFLGLASYNSLHLWRQAHLFIRHQMLPLNSKPVSSSSSRPVTLK